MRYLILPLLVVLSSAANAQEVPEIGALMASDRAVVQDSDEDNASDWGFTDDCGNAYFYIREDYNPRSQTRTMRAVARVDGVVYTLRQTGEPRELSRGGRSGSVMRFASPGNEITASAVVLWQEHEGGDCGYGDGGVAITKDGQEVTRDLSIQACAAMYGAY